MKVTDYQANQLNKRIRIVKEGERVSDGAGGYRQTWLPKWQGYAGLSPLSGRESVFAQQLQVIVSGRALLRYDGTVFLGGYVLEYGARRMNIEASINVEEANRWVVLFYSEGGAV